MQKWLFYICNLIITMQTSENKKIKIVAAWVYVGIAMLLIQVLLGGITRLTGSGLSITEWKPIMGALPPLNEKDWLIAFNKYQQIAQYKYLNTHFTLNDFKFIFFWEWFHRQWARFIGVVFLLPFIYFLVKGYFKKWMINPLIILFLLGALQGAIGWIMVKSGINDTDIYVNHIKLAIHFISAMILICYALIFALSLTTNKEEKVKDASLKKILLVTIFLISIQLLYGGFMAGLKAANAAPTWPLINGMLIPNNLGSIFNDRITIHLIHRTLAYILFFITVYYWFKAKKINYSSLFNQYKNWPFILIIVQIILGIASVLVSPHIKIGSFGMFEWLALFHQLIGMCLLLSFIAVNYLIKFK